MSASRPDNGTENAKEAQHALFHTARNGETFPPGQKQGNAKITPETLFLGRPIGAGNYTSLPFPYDEPLNRPQWKTPNSAEIAVTTIATEQPKLATSALNSEAVDLTGRLQYSNSEAVAPSSSARPTTSWLHRLGGKRLIFKHDPAVPIFEFFENNPARSWKHFAAKESGKDVGERHPGSPFPIVCQEDTRNQGQLVPIDSDLSEDGHNSFEVSENQLSTIPVTNDSLAEAPGSTKPENKLATTACLSRDNVERFHQGHKEHVYHGANIVKTENVQLCQTFTRFSPTSGDRLQWERVWNFGRTTVVDQNGHQVTSTIIGGSRHDKPQSHDAATGGQLVKETDVLTEEPGETSFVDISKQPTPKEEMRGLAVAPQLLPSGQDQVILCSGLELHDVAEVSIYHDNSAGYDFVSDHRVSEDRTSFQRQHPMGNDMRTVYADCGALQMEADAMEDMISVDIGFERELPEATGASPLTDVGDRVISVQEVTLPGTSSPHWQPSGEDQVTPDGEGQDSRTAIAYEHVTVTSDGSPKSASTGDSVLPCGQQTPQEAINDDAPDEEDCSQQDAGYSDTKPIEDDDSGEDVRAVPGMGVGVAETAAPPWIIREPDQKVCFESMDDESEITLGSSDTEDLSSYTLSSGSCTDSADEYDSYDDPMSLGFSCETEVTPSETKVIKPNAFEDSETQEPVSANSISEVTAGTVSTTSDSEARVPHPDEVGYHGELEQSENKELEDEQLFATEDSDSDHSNEERGLVTVSTSLVAPTSASCGDEGGVQLDVPRTTMSPERVSSADEAESHVDEHPRGQRKLVEYSQDTSEEELVEPPEDPDPSNLDKDQTARNAEDTPPEDLRNEDHERDETSMKTYTKVMEVYFSQDSRQFVVVPTTSDCVVPESTPTFQKQKRAEVRVPDSVELCKFQALNETRPGTYEAHVETSEASFYNEERDDPGPKRKLPRLGLQRSHRGRRLHPNWTGAPPN